MGKSSAIRHPHKARFTKTYQWQMELLKPLGKTAACAAELLSLLEFYHNIEEEKLGSNHQNNRVPIKCSVSFLERNLFKKYGRNSIMKGLDYLNKENLLYIKKTQNGIANEYHLNIKLLNLQADLYTKREPFKYKSEKQDQFKNEQVTSLKEDSNLFKNEQGVFKDEQVTSLKEDRHLFKNEQETCLNLNTIYISIDLLKIINRNTHSEVSEDFLKKFFSQVVIKYWEDWKKHLSEAHQMQYTKTQEIYALAKLIQLAERKSSQASEIISYSISGGWKSLCVKTNLSKKTKNFPDTWNKSFFLKLETKRHSAYFRHLRSQGLKAVKRNGEITDWIPNDQYQPQSS